MLRLQLVCVCVAVLGAGRLAGGWATLRHLDDYDLEPATIFGAERLEPVGQFRRITWTPEGIPVRTIYPPGYEPPPQPPPAPPTTAAPTTSVQLVDLNQSLRRKKTKKKKRRPVSSWDALEQEEEDYDDYRDQYDEEEDLDFQDLSSEEADDEGGSSEELNDASNGKKKNKNKSKNKGKNKRKKQAGGGGEVRRPPPWEKYVPLPRPQRLQEVELWGYQNEYNRGWGKNKKLAEQQKAAFLAARKREAEYREWFENLPEERQEWILRTQAEERRRKGYKAYAQSLRVIGGLPLAPSGPQSDFYPPPGWPAGGAVGAGGGGWTTRLYRILLEEER